MRTKFQFIQTICRRCGKSITTGNKSLYGANQAKAKYNRICKNCVTEEEVFQMNQEIGQGFIKIGDR